MGSTLVDFLRTQLVVESLTSRTSFMFAEFQSRFTAELNIFKHSDLTATVQDLLLL